MSYDSTLLELMRDQPRRSQRTIAVRLPYFARLLPRTDRQTLATVVLLCATFLAASCFPLHHTDLWGHLSFGRWIAEHGMLPAADPFRPFDHATTFTNLPWLAQWAGYLAYQAGGAQALLLIHATLVTSLCAALVVATRRRGVSPAWSLIAAGTMLLLASPVLGVLRPQLPGMVLFVFVLLGLNQLRARRHPILWLPALFALWANLHGSFVLGLLVVACWTVGTTLEARLADDTWMRVFRYRSIRRPWLVCLLATLACCANPVGPAVYLQVLSVSAQSNLAQITEWQPTVLTSLTGVLFYASCLATAVLIRFSPCRIRAEEVLILLVFGVLALSTLRLASWWALVWPWIVAPHASACWQRVASQLSRPQFRTPVSIRNTCVALALLFVTLVWSPATNAYLSGRAPIEAALVSRATPLPLADALDELDISGRLFAPLEWSDYLLWRRAGDIQPLVYCHVHLASPHIWQDYQNLTRADDAFPSLADRHQLRWLVLDRNQHHALLARLVDEPRARLMYQDRRAVVFEWLRDSARSSDDWVDESQRPAAPLNGAVEKNQHPPPATRTPSADADVAKYVSHKA